MHGVMIIVTKILQKYNLIVMEEVWNKSMDSLNLRELEVQIADLVDKSTIQEMLRIQLTELEMLQSMFSNPGEFCIDDYSLLADINNFLDGKTGEIPSRLDFVINLNIESNKLEVCVNLPLEYPTLEPDIYVRSENLNRNQQHLLNVEVSTFISSLERGELCICSVIQWLQENSIKYFDQNQISDVEPETLIQENQELFTRYWIYSHHIYSKIKRRELLDLAHEYNISGFCLPGRPGIICIEGLASECDEWWQKVKCMNWKKIMCKKKETAVLENKNIESQRRFTLFKEVSFGGNKIKSRDYHMDFGEFYKYLLDHNCDYIFKDYFGVDGKQVTNH